MEPPLKSGKERWLVTGWPGMGSVAVTAAVYLMAKLRMHEIGEFEARDLFELEHVIVHGGLVRAESLPRSRLFMCDAGVGGGREIVVFTGEAQPALGKLALCDRLIARARELGVTRVFSFAASATDEPPTPRARVFGVATDAAGLANLRKHEIPLMGDGRISGLNGVLLAAAAEKGIPGIGLLGELPVFAGNLPYPTAAVSVLRAFCGMADITLDLADLEEYGGQMQSQLSEAYTKVRDALERSRVDYRPEQPKPDLRPSEESEQALHVERLFKEAEGDRAKAFALKRELDRLNLFRAYEDRFLNLFRKK